MGESAATASHSGSRAEAANILKETFSCARSSIRDALGADKFSYVAAPRSVVIFALNLWS